MSDSTSKPASEDTFPNPSPPRNRPESACPTSSADDLAAALRAQLPNHCLPADLKELILAELPTPEERERLLRNLMETGGLSSEEFLASLGIEGEPVP